MCTCARLRQGKNTTNKLRPVYLLHVHAHTPHPFVYPPRMALVPRLGLEHFECVSESPGGPVFSVAAASLSVKWAHWGTLGDTGPAGMLGWAEEISGRVRLSAGRPVLRTPLQVLGPHGCGQPVRAHCEAAVGTRGRASGVQYGTGGCTRGRQLDGGDRAGTRAQGGDIPGGACGSPVHGAWALSAVPGLWSLCEFSLQSELGSGCCIRVERQGQPETPEADA